MTNLAPKEGNIKKRLRAYTKVVDKDAPPHKYAPAPKRIRKNSSKKQGSMAYNKEVWDGMTVVRDLIWEVVPLRKVILKAILDLWDFYYSHWKEWKPELAMHRVILFEKMLRKQSLFAKEYLEMQALFDQHWGIPQSGPIHLLSETQSKDSIKRCFYNNAAVDQSTQYLSETEAKDSIKRGFFRNAAVLWLNQCPILEPEKNNII